MALFSQTQHEVFLACSREFEEVDMVLTERIKAARETH
jgi:hypothetical protein